MSLHVARTGWTSWTDHATADGRRTLCGRLVWTPIRPLTDFNARLVRYPNGCCKTCARRAALGEDS